MAIGVTDAVAGTELARRSLALVSLRERSPVSDCARPSGRARQRCGQFAGAGDTARWRAVK